MNPATTLSSSIRKPRCFSCDGVLGQTNIDHLSLTVLFLKILWSSSITTTPFFKEKRNKGLLLRRGRRNQRNPRLRKLVIIHPHQHNWLNIDFLYLTSFVLQNHTSKCDVSFTIFPWLRIWLKIDGINLQHLIVEFQNPSTVFTYATQAVMATPDKQAQKKALWDHFMTLKQRYKALLEFEWRLWYSVCSLCASFWSTLSVFDQYCAHYFQSFLCQYSNSSVNLFYLLVDFLNKSVTVNFFIYFIFLLVAYIALFVIHTGCYTFPYLYCSWKGNPDSTVQLIGIRRYKLSSGRH